MPDIIGRKEEIQELSSLFSSSKSEFAVVYGRRRVGKTFLIDEFFKSKKCVYFHVTGVQDGLLKEQLQEFSKAIGKTFYSGANIAASASWMKGFEELNSAIESVAKTKKIVIFIDELPWLATRRSRLLQALDYYWNHYWSKNKKLKLIVCGSSASWMIKNIVYNKGGLHNRYTRALRIAPFTLQETKEFLLNRKFNLPNTQVLEIYMVMGGVPHYLDNLKKGLSATQNIDKLCFDENGILYSEFDKLFKSLFEDHKVYIELIRIVAGARYGVSRATIEEKSKLTQKGGTLSERLSDLEQAGFIKSFLPHNHQRQGIYYRILDEYVYFYLLWIEPQKRKLYMASQNYWQNQKKSPQYLAWRGYSFEAVCYKHLNKIQKTLKIPDGSSAETWRYAPKKEGEERGAQIDLLFERKDGSITVCEIKMTDKPFALDKLNYENLLQKVELYKKVTNTTKHVFLALITAQGMAKSKYQHIIDQVANLEDLF